MRRRHVYHVKYEDGDSEDFDDGEHKYAYELRQAVDNGRSVPDFLDEQNEHDGASSDDGTVVSGAKIIAKSKRSRKSHPDLSDDNAPVKRKRGQTVGGVAVNAKKRSKSLNKMETKPYTELKP